MSARGEFQMSVDTSRPTCAQPPVWLCADRSRDGRARSHCGDGVVRRIAIPGASSTGGRNTSLIGGWFVGSRGWVMTYNLSVEQI